VVQEIAVQTEWLIFVIHHHKKNANGEGSDNLSGTGDFGAAADVLWTWSRPADAAKPGLLEIEGRVPPVDPMVVLLNPDECILLGTRQESAEEDEKCKIFDALGNEQVSGKELGLKTGIPYSTVMKRLNALKAEDNVDCKKGDGKGSVLLWFQSVIDCSNDPQVNEAS
jgi:biotin operon repressor